jgi:diguanylate cyclase (GGDEF)-like protein
MWIPSLGKPAGCSAGLLARRPRRRKIEADLERIAYFDPLTGLSNRRGTLMRFEDEISRAERRGRQFGLLVMDLDHFKRVNDTYGHQAGDAVLVHAAVTLGAGKRREDALGRIGGEEFLVIFTDVSAQEAFDGANRLCRRLADSSLAYDDKNLSVTVSGGLAIYPSDGTDWDTLFSVADQRLYEAKQNGRNRVVGAASAGQEPEAEPRTSEFVSVRGT